MKKIFFTVIALSIVFNINAQFPYFSVNPNFSFSTTGKNDTGLGIADMNNDGWKDIIIANGNDIVRWNVEIYYNNGDGTFPNLPDWSSDDIDYHGHLAIADLDGNGWNDVITSVYIGPGGFSEPGKLKIYFNNEGTIETTPSLQSIDFYSFSCAVGDADGDGDLDIAVATGEAYNEEFEHNMVFLNDNGSFTSSPQWLSADTSCSYDVDFADFDRNGFMDLVFANELTQSRIYLSDNQGQISTEAAWHNQGDLLSSNSLDIGFIDDNIYPDLVISNNDQQYGDGKLKCYLFDDGGIPDSSAANWESEYYHYQSGVYLYDLDNNDTLDLLLGGWWDPVYAFYGNGNGFELNPAYTSSTNSVVEAILLSDLDRSHIDTITETTTVWQDSASIIYMSKQPVENIIEVQVNSEVINASDYAFVPGKNWISLKNNAYAGDVVQIDYEYSKYCDMVVSNWDGTDYIFYNQTDTSSINIEELERENVVVYPNPASEFIYIDARNSELIKIEIIDSQGNLAMAKSFDNQRIDVGALPKGIYFVKIYAKNNLRIEKLIIQ